MFYIYNSFVIRQKIIWLLKIFFCFQRTSKFPSKPLNEVEAGALLLKILERSLQSGFVNESLKGNKNQYVKEKEKKKKDLN